MSNLGERLRQERERLGITREKLGEIGGVTGTTQTTYEKDVRRPDTDYLLAIEQAGADIFYILRGEPSPARSLSPDEQELLSSYRGLDIRGKAGVLGMIEGMRGSEKMHETLKKQGITIHGSIGGGMHNIKGDIIGNIDMSVTNSAERKKRPR
ncbi:MAG: helix-turn-helix domain-containing protein [Ottowia sp.]|nr:helix-turn-helix domain-containing protein [Ottowia sp.]